MLTLTEGVTYKASMWKVNLVSIGVQMEWGSVESYTTVAVFQALFLPLLATPKF